MTEIRIAWKIGGASGHRPWYPVEHRESFLKALEYACEVYGDGTHWLEEREA